VARQLRSLKVRSARLLLSAAVCALVFLAVTESAQAQMTIRNSGQHPQDHFELEPHLVLSPFDSPDDPSNDGYGVGVRGTLEVAPDGFIPNLNDSVGVGFGLDWVHYDYPQNRALCRRFEPTAQGVPVCVETSAHGSSYLFVPVVMQWNFWLHPRWSVFGEPGLAVSHRSDGGFGVSPVFMAGGRFHISDNVALTLRLGYPTFSFGVSFLF
jgi:hypothetical protein